MGDAVASQEYLLLDYAQRLDRHRQGRRAVHIHLSGLKPQNRRDHHIRIAANTFEELVKQFEGQIFMLATGDLIFVCRDAAISDIDEAIMRLRYLFSEDPLTQQTDGEEDKFCTWYNIEAQYPKFLAMAERLYEEEQKRTRRLQAASTQGGGDQVDTRKPLGPEQLGRLEQFLRQADLSSLMRRQSICAMAPQAAPKPVFKELFISIGDLARTVLPDVNLAANRWLFQHLTQTLDRRMLKILSRGDDSDLLASFSINLNVETLLSPEFLQFDSSLRMGSRGTIVIELQLLDIFADINAFIFARDFVREKGYRICLDGVSHLTLPFIDRQKMSVDLVKIVASPTMSDEMEAAALAEFKTMVERVGKARIILSRVDSPTQARFGQQAGIPMFQGRHIDSLVQQEQRRARDAAKGRRRA